MKKWKAALGIVIMSIGLGVTGCSAGAQAEGDTIAVQSVSMLAGLGNTGLQNRYAGVVVAQATHTVSKDDERTIAKLKVAVGDEVRKGQVLFTYDTDEIQLTLDSANLEMEKLQNSIDSMKSQITSLEKEKAKAKSSDQLSYSIEIQSLQADIKESEYNMKTKKLELERLEKILKNSRVKSEYNGIIQSINDGSQNNNSEEYYYEENSSGSAYITIVETGSYRIKGVINEVNMADIGMLEGSSVLIRSRVDSSLTWTGTLGAVDMENPEKNNDNYYYYESDESTSSSKYPFYVDLDDSEGLMMGQHVYIELNQGQDEEKSGIWLPSYYLELSDSGNYVWAATGKDKLEKREIMVGEYNAELDTWEIVGGLDADDYIAIPSEELKAGLPVTRYDEEYFTDSYGDGEDLYMGEDAYTEGEYAEGEYAEGEYAEGEAIDENAYSDDAAEGESTDGEFTEGMDAAGEVIEVGAEEYQEEVTEE